VSRRAVGPRWHDAVANTIVSTMTMSYFRSEVGSHQRARCRRQIIAVGLPAFVYLKRAGKQRSDWPPDEAVVRIGLGAICPAVSGEKCAPTENAGHSTYYYKVSTSLSCIMLAF
jgi:hypothetical protein